MTDNLHMEPDQEGQTLLTLMDVLYGAYNDDSDGEGDWKCYVRSGPDKRYHKFPILRLQKLEKHRQIVLLVDWSDPTPHDYGDDD